MGKENMVFIDRAYSCANEGGLGSTPQGHLITTFFCVKCSKNTYGPSDPKEVPAGVGGGTRLVWDIMCDKVIGMPVLS